MQGVQFEQENSGADYGTWFSAQEYCDALIQLDESIETLQLLMLIEHAAAPNSLVSINALAASFGYPTPHVVYSKYGKLAKNLAKALGIGDQQGVQTRIIGADKRNESGEVIWAMHPELVEALRILKWAPESSSTVTSVDHFDELNESDVEFLSETEREAVVRTRICQGIFRTSLIKYWGSCAVTGVSESSVLRASHIKPWRSCDNSERVDVFNGFLLAAHIDALFDSGLITFEFDGLIRLSPQLASKDIHLLGVLPTMRLRKIRLEHKEYLRHHHQIFLSGGNL